MTAWINSKEYQYFLRALDESVEVQLDILSHCDPTDVAKVANVQASIRWIRTVTSGELAQTIVGELEEHERRDDN